MSDAKKRNASSTSFGFQYQINVAIYFMFNYLKSIKNIRVEGEDQDIEVTLMDGLKYMIQAKSKTKDIYNNEGNAEKLRSALESLAESDNEGVKYLYYAANMQNPLNTPTNEFERNDVTIRKYDELTIESREKIDNQIANNISSKGMFYDIDRKKLVVIRIPFFGDFEAEKYKFIYEEAKNVLTIMSDTLASKHTTIVKYCESKFLNNSSTNPKKKISKEEFCNWIILIEVESLDLSNEYDKIGIDELDYTEALEKYQNYLDEKISSYEDYTKVYSLFSKKNRNIKVSVSDFVKEEKVELYNYFFNGNLKSKDEINDKIILDVYISQIISYAILKKKSIISKVEKEANL